MLCEALLFGLLLPYRFHFPLVCGSSITHLRHTEITSCTWLCCSFFEYLFRFKEFGVCILPVPRWPSKSNMPSFSQLFPYLTLLQPHFLPLPDRHAPFSFRDLTQVVLSALNSFLLVLHSQNSYKSFRSQLLGQLP